MEYITRRKAVYILNTLACSEVLSEDVTTMLEDIALCIEEERFGRHIWGADVEDVSFIHSAWHEDKFSDDKLIKWNALNKKYVFEPALYESDMLDGGRFIDPDDECDPFD